MGELFILGVIALQITFTIWIIARVLTLADRFVTAVERIAAKH